jgi:hypothetical protein
MSEQITVPATSTNAAVLTLARYLLTALGSLLLVDNGIMSNDTLQDVIGAVMVIAPAIQGVVLSIRDSRKQRQMAEALPDRLAVVK